MNAKTDVNGSRLWNRLMEMAKIGATDKGGCNRQALTDLDKDGRDLFCAWARNAGCTIKIDQMGNIFARREGRNIESASVIAGSHLDTQPTGGKFDGVYGVLAALEVIETLNDHSIETDHPIEAVVWTNEEGARFSPAMIGSGVFCGEFEIEFAHKIEDKNGVQLGEELSRINYCGDASCAPFPIKAAFEAHIEQGPILEAEDKTIGVVTGVQGMRWFNIVISGEPVHAGPTPMNARKDPMNALSKIMTAIYEITSDYAPDSRATFGDVAATPGSRNTVPEVVTLAVDIRHPNEAMLDEIDHQMRTAIDKISTETKTSAIVETIWHSPAVEFDQGCISAVRAGVEKTGKDYMEMVSGAGHDSVYISRVAPTAMIFVPCKDGISHNEAEDAKPEHLETGANVLLNAIIELAS